MLARFRRPLTLQFDDFSPPDSLDDTGSFWDPMPMELALKRTDGRYASHAVEIAVGGAERGLVYPGAKTSHRN